MMQNEAPQARSYNIKNAYSNRASPYPDDDALQKSYVIDRYMMRGWMPSEPFITRETPIVAFGSCFASNISNYLHDRGYNVLTKGGSRTFVTQMGDEMTHTYAILQQFEWAWENRFPTVEIWDGYDAREFGFTDGARQDTLALFNTADVFIVTLGLSELWYDEPTGEVFWKVPPPGKFDPGRHKFRVASFDETKRNLAAIREIIRKHRPDATIVFSVSPIPLKASFRPVPCLSANAASKAIVRAAVDEYYREASHLDDKFFYFPSYDIVKYAFNHQWMADRRHVNKEVLAFNMSIFEHKYCSPGIDADKVLQAYRKAQAKDEHIAKHGHEDPAAVEARKQDRLAKRLAQKAADKETERAARVQGRIDARKAAG